MNHRPEALWQLHPYVTVRLNVLWLPDSVTDRAEAVLTGMDNRPAYRLTPPVYAALFSNVDQLEWKWKTDQVGLSEARREALGKATGILKELWDWLADQAGGRVLTEHPRLPTVKKLLLEVEMIAKTVPLEEYNPTLPIPNLLPTPNFESATSSPTKKRRARKKKVTRDAITTRLQSAGMFD